MKVLPILLLAGMLSCNLPAADKTVVAKSKPTSIPGIALDTEAKLNAAGINNVTDLLAEGATEEGRTEIAVRSGLSAEQVLAFVRCADLFRIKGIGGEAAELLLAVGVKSVPELASREAAELVLKLQEAAAAKKAKVPNERELAEWIAEAKTLPKIVTD
jgi:predicted flap endonuclease-1-like 5' DNA nuclease